MQVRNFSHRASAYPGTADYENALLSFRSLFAVLIVRRIAFGKANRFFKWPLTNIYFFLIRPPGTAQNIGAVGSEDAIPHFAGCPFANGSNQYPIGDASKGLQPLRFERAAPSPEFALGRRHEGIPRNAGKVRKLRNLGRKSVRWLYEEYNACAARLKRPRASIRANGC
jgi:hypothetical protein